jgi:hypothetical protein
LPNEYELGWYYLDYKTNMKERRHPENEYNSPSEVAARLAWVREEREIAEHHRRQDDKVREFLSDTP